MRRIGARRILFVRTDRLGETLLNLPTLAALKAACSDATVTMLAAQTLAPLLRGAPDIIDNILCAPRASGGWLPEAIATARLLRPHRFDVAIVSNPKKSLHLAVWLAGIPCRIGYDRKWGWLLTHRVPDRTGRGQRHEVDCNLDLIRALGHDVTAGVCSLSVSSSEERWVERLLAQQGIDDGATLIAVHPFSSTPQKQWGRESFVELMRQLSCAGRATVVVIGEAAAADIEGFESSGVAVINLVNRLTLPQLAALLRRVQLLISVDSGPVHLAAAVGTPTVVLFGTTDPARGPVRWAPWGTGHCVIHKASLEAITVTEVVQAAQQQLAQRKIAG